MLLLLAFSCQRKYTHEELEAELNRSMTAYLYEENDKDSSHVRYRIQHTAFFEEKNSFETEFTVNVHTLQTGHDTTGVMKASISKDFKTVKRIF